MRFYLSSYKVGNKVEELKSLINWNKKVAYIPNATGKTIINNKGYSNLHGFIKMSFASS